MISYAYLGRYQYPISLFPFYQHDAEISVIHLYIRQTTKMIL